jgi:hypothetical protein
VIARRQCARDSRSIRGSVHARITPFSKRAAETPEVRFLHCPQAMSFRQSLRVLIFALSWLASSRVARAEDAHAAPSASAVPTLHRLNLGLRLGTWSSHSAQSPSGGLLAGLDASYLVNPYLGFGAELVRYGDLLSPEYHALDLNSGTTGLAFAEGRYPLASFLSPYARAGAGVSHLQLTQELVPWRQEQHNVGALGAELGIEAHYGVSLRVFGFTLLHPTVAEAAALYGLGAQLGARF